MEVFTVTQVNRESYCLIGALTH